MFLLNLFRFIQILMNKKKQNKYCLATTQSFWKFSKRLRKWMLRRVIANLDSYLYLLHFFGRRICYASSNDIDKIPFYETSGPNKCNIWNILELYYPHTLTHTHARAYMRIIYVSITSTHFSNENNKLFFSYICF